MQQFDSSEEEKDSGSEEEEEDPYDGMVEDVAPNILDGMDERENAQIKKQHHPTPWYLLIVYMIILLFYGTVIIGTISKW